MGFALSVHARCRRLLTSSWYFIVLPGHLFFWNRVPRTWCLVRRDDLSWPDIWMSILTWHWYDLLLKIYAPCPAFSRDCKFLDGMDKELLICWC